MSNLDKVLDEAMNLTLEQQEMLVQSSFSEFQAGTLKIQTATKAIAELRDDKYIQ